MCLSHVHVSLSPFLPLSLKKSTQMRPGVRINKTNTQRVQPSVLLGGDRQSGPAGLGLPRNSPSRARPNSPAPTWGLGETWAPSKGAWSRRATDRVPAWAPEVRGVAAPFTPSPHFPQPQAGQTQARGGGVGTGVRGSSQKNQEATALFLRPQGPLIPYSMGALCKVCRPPTGHPNPPRSPHPFPEPIPRPTPSRKDSVGGGEGVTNPTPRPSGLPFSPPPPRFSPGGTQSFRGEGSHHR